MRCQKIRTTLMRLFLSLCVGACPTFRGALVQQPVPDLSDRTPAATLDRSHKPYTHCKVRKPNPINQPEEKKTAGLISFSSLTAQNISVSLG